ncbi:hypothetical protein WR25_00362 [Diploscapter pachys]|uniref:Uncharacterized protein n=1 Tax=Diploscapter pachys TaxID=2018661 RepID=A0A2A2JYY1_9BILA|nr:hypothetical protein WR25_00362 [Diploscapter pachys]
MSDLVENIENMDVNAIRDKADKDMLENVEKLISDLDLDCKQEELQNRNKNKKGSEEEAEAVEVQKDQEKLPANDVDEEKTESEEETQDNSSGDSSTTSDSCSAEGEEGCLVKEESKTEAEKDGQRKADGHGLDAGILTDRLNKSAAVQVKLTGNETDLANYSQDKTVNAPPSTPVVMTADESKPLIVDGPTTAADEKQKMEHLRGGADKEEEDSSMHTAASPDPLLKQSNKESSDADGGEEKNDNMQNPVDNLDEKKKSVCSIC